MIAALQAISSAAGALKTDELVKESRVRLRPHFDAFKAAESRVSLLVSSVGKDDGDWIRSVANNFAADLLQADEFADYPLSADDEDLAGYSPEDAEILRRSSSYFSAASAESLRGEGAMSLNRWWGDRVISGTRSSFPNVYSVNSSYIIQHCRLLDDFVREYMEPWAEKVVRDRLK